MSYKAKCIGMIILATILVAAVIIEISVLYPKFLQTAA